MSDSILVLVTGGVKSGKSELASKCADALSLNPLMIATARRFDNEFNARIQRHIDERPNHWRTVEAPIDIATELDHHAQEVVVIDCLGVWLTNILIETPDQLADKTDELLKALSKRSKPTIIVSNESGLGAIGADSLTRQFIDELGLLNQSIAKQSSHFVINFSGFPVWLKGSAII